MPVSKKKISVPDFSPLTIPPGKLIAVDCETTGLLAWKGDQPFAVSFCNEKGKTGYVQWLVNPKTRKVIVSESDLKILREFLADESITKVFFNSSFDIRMFEVGLGLPVKGTIEDSQISMHVCNTAEMSYKLKHLCKKYGIMGDDDEKELKKLVVSCRLKAKKLNWKIHDSVEADYWIPKQLFPSDRTCEIYAVKDAVRTMELWLQTVEFMEQSKRFDSYLFEMRKLAPILREMENRGMTIDPDVIADEIDNCVFEREKAKRVLCKIAKKPDLNPNSDPQIRKLLFQDLKLEPTILTEKGQQPSTSSEALKDHSDNSTVQILMRYRHFDKGISSFFEPFNEYRVHDKRTGSWIIHPNIRQAGKLTARLSCSNPNLQGLTDAEGGRSESEVPARKPFGPRSGYVWILADYNQLEVRTFAAASKYQLLIDILRSGRDLHTEATNGIWGGKGNDRAIAAAMHALGTTNEGEANKWLASFDYDIVKAEASVGKKTSRNKGKPFFFTRMFGGGPDSISEKLKCSWQDAKELINSYDETLPGVIEFVRQMAKIGESQGYIETMYGRKLDFEPHQEYKASPYVVQGTAADLVKRALIECDEYNKKKRVDGGLLLQIHDELIFEFKDSVDKSHIDNLKTIMEAQERYIGLEVPCKMKIVKRYWSEPENLS